jgi:hypothetical protein
VLDPTNVSAAIEWEITHPAATEPIAVIRKLRLGAGRVVYFRAVTYDADSSKRELIGYWGSLDEATQNVHGLYERHLPPESLISTKGLPREPLPLTQPKQPPAS